MRTVVVGASSGLGRCIGIGLAQRGDEVALLARRHDKLVEAAKEAGPGTLAIACDVTDQESCQRAISEAVAGLGGIDGLVYATGVGPLHRLAEIDATTWRHAFDTNVIGAALITSAAIPHLEASSGTAAYLSSISASMTPPWPGLGAYAVTKAALDKLVEAWREEHPSVGLHPGHRGRLHGRRRRRDDPIRQRLERRSRGRGGHQLGYARLHRRQFDAGRGAGQGGLARDAVRRDHHDSLGHGDSSPGKLTLVRNDGPRSGSERGPCLCWVSRIRSGRR